MSIIRPAELEVHVDEGVADEDVAREATPEDESVHHLAVRPGEKPSAGLKDRGESELVGGWAASSEEAAEVVESGRVEAVEGEGAEEGVPRDDVGVAQDVEDEGGVTGVGPFGGGTDELDGDEVGVDGLGGRRRGDEAGVELEELADGQRGGAF